MYILEREVASALQNYINGDRKIDHSPLRPWKMRCFFLHRKKRMGVQAVENMVKKIRKTGDAL